jgi:hypothetical protein
MEFWLPSVFDLDRCNEANPMIYRQLQNRDTEVVHRTLVAVGHRALDDDFVADQRTCGVDILDRLNN